MKVEIFRLTSIDPYGIGNKGNGLLDLLYSHFLWENGLDFYKFIIVNQIHQDQGIAEFVEIKERLVHINIIWNTNVHFDRLSDTAKNRVRIDVIHAGLLRLEAKDPRFKKSILEKIKEEILEKNFDFEFKGESKINLYDSATVCNFVVKPRTEYFDFYFLAQKNGNDLCRIHIYRGKPTTYYLGSLFSKMTWKDEHHVIVEGREKQMKIVLDIASCKVSFQNLTNYPKPPLWEMMKGEINEDENSSAYENWLHSLPPSYSAVIRKSDN